MKCYNCGCTDDDSFYSGRRSPSKSLCIDCTKRYYFEKGLFLKLKAIEYLGGKCVNCGYQGCPAAFDFHHRDPSLKDMSISVMLRRHSYWDELKIELDKCDLVCATCHRELHNGDKVDVEFQFDMSEILSQQRRRSKRAAAKIREDATCRGCGGPLPPESELTRLYCCPECEMEHKRSVRREQVPSAEELARLDGEMDRQQLARHYGISGKRLLRWLRLRGVYTPRYIGPQGKVCEVCKGVFFPTDHRHDLCSRDCYNKYMRRHWPPQPELEEKLSSMSIRGVARYYGVHHSTVTKWIRDYGVSR